MNGTMNTRQAVTVTIAGCILLLIMTLTIMSSYHRGVPQQHNPFPTGSNVAYVIDKPGYAIVVSEHYRHRLSFKRLLIDGPVTDDELMLLVTPEHGRRYLYFTGPNYELIIPKRFSPAIQRITF